MKSIQEALSQAVAKLPLLPALITTEDFHPKMDIGTKLNTPTGIVRIIGTTTKSKRIYHCETCNRRVMASNTQLVKQGCRHCAKDKREEGKELQASMEILRLIETKADKAIRLGAPFANMLTKRVSKDREQRRVKQAVPMTHPASAVYDWTTKEVIRKAKKAKR